jgi:hypothetical protein
LQLLSEDKLIAPRFDVLARVPKGSRFELSACTYSDRDSDGLRVWLDRLDRVVMERREIGGHSTVYAKTGILPLNSFPHDWQPLEIYFSARVNLEKCVVSHALQTDDDWNWFQGPPSQKATIESRGAGMITGFAEGADAELLVELADIYLNGPLFQLINLVDTPGLNSTTEAHSRTTEEFIQRGTGFLIVLPLENAATDHSTELLFEMIRLSLNARNIAPQEHADHIFIVLNHFRKFSDEVSVKHIENLRDFAAARFDRPVRVYAVNLKEQVSSDRFSEQLLGFPSISQLFRDLRKYVARQGLAQKLVTAGAELDRTWRDLLTQQSRERSDMEGHSVLATAAALAKSDKALKGAVSKAREFAASRIARAEEAAEEVNHLIDSLRDKQSFVDAQTNWQLLDAFNTAVKNLNLIATNARELFRSAVQEVIEPPDFADFAVIGTIPVLKPVSFRESVEQIVRDWPGVAKRAWARIERYWKNSNFASHGEFQRDELQREYFSHKTRTAILEALSTLGKAFESQVTQAEDQGIASIATRTTMLKPVQDSLARRRESWERRNRELDEFNPTYQDTRRVLQEHEDEMRRICERE